MMDSDHTPLHLIETPGDYTTGGRLTRRDGAWWLTNATDRIALDLSAADVTDDDLSEAYLARVRGRFADGRLAVRDIRLHAGQSTDEQQGDTVGKRIRATRRRSDARRRIREWFATRGFTEVVTSHSLPSPGTDPYIEPAALHFAGSDDASHDRWMHTSPEFVMKRLLADGFERIYQLCRVWRGGDVTSRHRPEFSMLEWYRAWEDGAAIRDDVEQLVRDLAGPTATVVEQTVDGEATREVDLTESFSEIPMREVVSEACGFDIRNAMTAEALGEVCRQRNLVSDRTLQRHADNPRWDELFFELQVEHIDPWLARRGAVFVTDWPAPLGILAKKDPDDPEVAKRFELYVGGMELANGFVELTDPDEQRRRFERDLRDRREQGRPEIPMPSAFLSVLERGLPPSTGVALGFDRLLMIAHGAADIAAVAAPGL